MTLAILTAERSGDRFTYKIGFADREVFSTHDEAWAIELLTDLGVNSPTRWIEAARSGRLLEIAEGYDASV